MSSAIALVLTAVVGVAAAWAITVPLHRYKERRPKTPRDVAAEVGSAEEPAPEIRASYREARCAHCHRVCTWRDVVPLVSWFRGCAGCGTRLPATVPLVQVGLSLAMAGPALAGRPTGVHIESHMDFNPDGFNFGDFEASGPAVDAGLICASGTVDDVRIIFAGAQSGRKAQIPVWKVFTRDDDSGHLLIKIEVHLDFETSTESFSWVVLDAAGAYSDVHGSGGGSTVSDGSDPQTGNFNFYDGFLLD